MIYRQQFIGYWGKPQTNLITQIDRLFPSRSIELANLKIWQHNCHVISTERSIELSISAGALTPDAWLKFDPDRYLQLERDCYGKSTIYHTKTNDCIWFASHLQLLVKITENKQIDRAGVYGYSCFSYFPDRTTPLVGIQAVEAGQELTFNLDRSISITHHLTDWQPIEPQIEDEDTAISQLQTELIAAAERQIFDLEDRSIGVFLSGGLDSAIVAALLVGLGVKVRAYTLDFGEYGSSEFPYAELVCQHLNIPLIKVDARPGAIKRELMAAVGAIDLPFGDGVTVPLYLLSQAASQEVDLIFNGEGGDQLFAGWTNKPLIAARVYQHHVEFDRLYMQTFHRCWGYERSIFQSDFYNSIADLNAIDWIQSAIESPDDRAFLYRLRRANLILKGAQNIQPRATNLSSAWGLSVRSIFTDINLTRLSFQIAGELTLKASCEKYILKRAVTNWLPESIVWRTKRGMGVPLTSWCLAPFWHDLGTWLNPARLQAEGIWREDLATHVIGGKLGGIHGRRMGEILWLVVVWELWCEQHGLSPRDRSFLPWQHPFCLPPYFRTLTRREG
jgi:asparagine synthase (glutamine-hydrolysing)